MKISIVTACFNSETTIEKTICSVLEQNYPNIEYIIIDGKSTDATLGIVNKYKDKIAKIISEKDNGIYDALNKGIANCTGDVIGFLHSDDFYTDTNVISLIADEFMKKTIEALYADLEYVDKSNITKVFRVWKSGLYEDGKFFKGWMPPHPTFFVKKNLYERYGKFNTVFKFSADYELMLRFIHKYKIAIAYLPKTIVKMRVGGKSNSNLLNRIKANIEDRKAWEINGLTPKVYTLVFKPLLKLTQYFKK